MQNRFNQLTEQNAQLLSIVEELADANNWGFQLNYNRGELEWNGSGTIHKRAVALLKELKGGHLDE